ncbi:RNA methyltransferase [Candidatus Saccharibacteria bacterium]|nr:RNA methyltransferase [Candidatus Saccharibacteria bacterium]
MKSSQLIDLFQKSRSDDEIAIIEGVQALKHAVRFGAKIDMYITCDITMLSDLLAELADDVKNEILKDVTEVDQETFNKLSPRPHRTSVIALAKRRLYAFKDIDIDKPIVLLEEPRDLENIGAVIRVAAAADIGAVVITGPLDIWNPAIIRGAAGLHWAIPVMNFSQVPSFMRTHKSRPLISLDPTGKDINFTSISSNSILVFGTERHGISEKLLAQSDEIVRLPMKEGVSSLNLATSVAATLYQI